jgi:hypothetical protein
MTFKTQRAQQKHEQSAQHAAQLTRLRELLLEDDAL